MDGLTPGGGGLREVGASNSSGGVCIHCCSTISSIAAAASGATAPRTTRNPRRSKKNFSVSVSSEVASGRLETLKACQSAGGGAAPTAAEPMPGDLAPAAASLEGSSFSALLLMLQKDRQLLGRPLQERAGESCGVAGG